MILTIKKVVWAAMTAQARKAGLRPGDKVLLVWTEHKVSRRGNPRVAHLYRELRYNGQRFRPGPVKEVKE